MDFLAKVDIKLVGKAVIEKLIQTGAFDCFGASRENLLGNLDKAVEYAQNQKDDKKFGQSSLFGETGEKEYIDFVFENFPEISHLEKLKIEKQLIGFYFSGHPMDEYRQLWEKVVKVDLGHINTAEPGNQILVGIIKAIRTVNSKSGKMAYLTIADYNGEIDMIFFPKVWEIYQGRIKEDELAIVRGKIDFQKDRDKYSFIVDSLIDSQEVESAIAEDEVTQRKKEKFRNTWLYMADLKSGSLASAERGSYTVVGQLTALRETKDRNGNDMAFGTVHDFEGDIDLVFFSKIWSECREFLTLDEFTALKGSIDPANDRNPQKPSLKVSSIADIAALTRSASRKAAAGDMPRVSATISAEEQSETAAAPVHTVHVRLNVDAVGSDEKIYSLRNYILNNPGSCPVFIHISADGEKIIRANAGINREANPASCAGVAEVWKE
jgi:DNA polymerase-3 subunit alpha